MGTESSTMTVSEPDTVAQKQYSRDDTFYFSLVTFEVSGLEHHLEFTKVHFNRLKTVYSGYPSMS